MNKTMCAGFVLAALLFACPAWAWDGFDAESAELVEITPAIIPSAGEVITLNNKDQDLIQDCTVINVTRNKATVEVVVQFLNGELHTLVMEGI